MVDPWRKIPAEVPMADFEAVIQRTIDGLSENTPEMRARLYEKARGAVRRQLGDMSPRPSNTMIERQLEKLESSILAVERLISGEGAEQIVASRPSLTFEEHVPSVPRQQPGLAFGVNQGGRVAIASTSKATEADLAEIGGLRTVIIEAVDDLLAITTGSNAFRQIETIAARYRHALRDENGDMLVDILYAQGIRLENCAQQIRKQISANDYPDFSQGIAEALDSVLAIHGPLILSTIMGQALIAKGRAYNSEPSLDLDYREKAMHLWREARQKQAVFEPNDLEAILQINSEIQEGRRPEVSTELARTTNTNAISFLAKVLINGGVGIATTIVLSAVENTTAGSESTTELTALLNNTYLFFLYHKDSLVALSLIADQELAWLQSFIRWIELRRSSGIQIDY